MRTTPLETSRSSSLPRRVQGKRSCRLIISRTVLCYRWDKIVLKKWYTIFKDHIALEDYEIHDGMNLELYYQ